MERKREKTKTHARESQGGSQQGRQMKLQWLTVGYTKILQKRIGGVRILLVGASVQISAFCFYL